MKLFKNIKLWGKAHKSDITFYGGIACIVGGTVAACVATFKAKDDIEELQDELEVIHNDETIEEDEKNAKITKAYAKTGVKVGARYALAVGLEFTGIHLVRKDHKQLKADLATVGSALTSKVQEMRMYRKNVVAKEGKEADLEYMYGIKDREVTEIVEEDGVEIESHSTKKFIEGDIPGYSKWSRVFDDGCKGWTKDPETNISNLIIQQQLMTDKLRQDGFLFLNDVYDALGIPKTPEGQKVGWILGMGDDYVDFGLYNIFKPNGDYDVAKGNFINGYERVVLLDFNCDGYIIDNFPLGRKAVAK